MSFFFVWVLCGIGWSSIRLLRLFGLGLRLYLGAGFRWFISILNMRILLSAFSMFGGFFRRSLLALRVSLIRDQRYLHVDGPIMHLQSLERLQCGKLILFAVEFNKAKALASAVTFFNYMRTQDGHLFGEDLLELGILNREGKIRHKQSSLRSDSFPLSRSLRGCSGFGPWLEGLAGRRGYLLPRLAGVVVIIIVVVVVESLPRVASIPGVVVAPSIGIVVVVVPPPSASVVTRVVISPSVAVTLLLTLIKVILLLIAAIVLLISGPVLLLDTPV